MIRIFIILVLLAMPVSADDSGGIAAANANTSGSASGNDSYR